jgi:hypothetical protein
MTSVAGFVLTAVLPAIVWAEAMDKEPTLGQVWVIGSATAVLGFFGWRCHLAFGVAASLIAAVLAWVLHAELNDPHVGPAILEEAGRG